MVHRGDFHKVLLDAVFAASPEGMRAGNGRTGFDQAEDRVTLHLANGDRVTLHLANGDRVSGDVLIGADGVHSRIRQQMFGDGKAQLTGIVARPRRDASATAWRNTELRRRRGTR
jgi:salicylate hydroxylase